MFFHSLVLSFFFFFFFGSLLLSIDSLGDTVAVSFDSDLVDGDCLIFRFFVFSKLVCSLGKINRVIKTLLT